MYLCTLKENRSIGEIKMRSCLVVLAGMILLLQGCKNDKVAVVQVNTDTDTATVADTLVNPTEEELEQPMPVSAEKLFDDFIFNFVSSKRLQMERIAFPLKVNSGYKVEEIQKEDWQGSPGTGPLIPLFPMLLAKQVGMRNLLQQKEESKQELKALFERLGYSL